MKFEQKISFYMCVTAHTAAATFGQSHFLWASKEERATKALRELR